MESRVTNLRIYFAFDVDVECVPFFDVVVVVWRIIRNTDTDTVERGLIATYMTTKSDLVDKSRWLKIDR